MDKIEVERKLLLSKITDICAMAEKRSVLCSSSFLDPAEAAYIKRNLKPAGGVSYRLFGGYKDAERVVFSAFPDWMEEYCEEDIPIDTVCIRSRGKDELTHRDFLGAVLSLGISRDVIGDICVKEGNALVFCKSEISEYIIYNLTSIGRTSVKAEKFLGDTESFTVKDVVSESVNAASVRLDTVISAVYKVSRNVSCSLVEAGKVKLNFEECYKTDTRVCEGDLISVRGYGRVKFVSVGGVSKKGRLYLDIERYV